MVKDSIKRVDVSLFFAEDLFFNFCCFSSDILKKVCVDPAAYYVWDKRFGFSSSKEAGKAWIEDSNKIKTTIHNRLLEVGATPEVFFRLHLESLYAMLSYLRGVIKNKDLDTAYQIIEWANSLDHIKLAKEYINNELDDGKKWEELIFLTSDYSPETFYNRFK